MGRYTDAVKVSADWWDPDEFAWIRQTLAFIPSQRVIAHITKFPKFTDPSQMAEEVDFLEMADTMIAILLDTIDHWTLRQPGIPYEQGVERPKWDLTADTLAAQPKRDIEYLFTKAMGIFTDSVKPAKDIITQDAAQEGL